MKVNLRKNTETEPRIAPQPTFPQGPGTALSNMLESIGIKSTPNCSCKQKALTMNMEGNKWCENNIELITDWLADEAKKRSLPFLRAAGSMLIRRSIKKSKKEIDKN